MVGAGRAAMVGWLGTGLDLGLIYMLLVSMSILILYTLRLQNLQNL